MKTKKVFIKPWKLAEQEYGLDEDGDITSPANFMRQMEIEMPLDRIIEIDDQGKWTGWIITDEMIIGPAFYWGDEIEAGDDGKKWYPDIFYGIVPGKEHPYVCKNSWRFVRPIKIRNEIELTLKVNGQEMPLSTLSEETLLNIRRPAK